MRVPCALRVHNAIYRFQWTIQSINCRLGRAASLRTILNDRGFENYTTYLRENLNLEVTIRSLETVFYVAPPIRNEPHPFPISKILYRRWSVRNSFGTHTLFIYYYVIYSSKTLSNQLTGHVYTAWCNNTVIFLPDKIDIPFNTIVCIGFQVFSIRPTRSDTSVLYLWRTRLIADHVQVEFCEITGMRFSHSL